MVRELGAQAVKGIKENLVREDLDFMQLPPQDEGFTSKAVQGR